jgi:hypothetical protein
VVQNLLKRKKTGRSELSLATAKKRKTWDDGGAAYQRFPASYSVDPIAASCVAPRRVAHVCGSREGGRERRWHHASAESRELAMAVLTTLAVSDSGSVDNRHLGAGRGASSSEEWRWSAMVGGGRGVTSRARVVARHLAACLGQWGKAVG